MAFPYLFVGFVVIYTAAAAVIDVRTKRIPNYLTVTAAVLGMAFHSLAQGGWGLGASLTGFAVGFGLLLLPWMLGGGGMGDVKLLAALGAWLGTKYMLVAFVVSVMFSAVAAMVILAWVAVSIGVSRAKVQHLTMANPDNVEAAIARPQRRMLPFAVPVALSTWAVLAWVMLQGKI